MFEANHQCVSKVNFFYKDGTFESATRGNTFANNRCDPYKYWSRIKHQCERNSKIEKASWTFDHSINGHSFERIVDIEDACSLTYKTFQHNDWLKIDGEAIVLNTPVYKNGYKYPINQDIKIPTQPYINDSLLKKLEVFYWSLWVFMAISILYKVISVSLKK